MEREENRSFRKFAETTTGIVTSAYPGFKSRDDGEPPFIEYRFSVDGREYTGSSEDYVPEGDEVEILFLPSDPSNNQSMDNIDQYKYTFIWTLFFGVFTIICFALGFNSNSHKLIGADSNKIEPQPFIRFPIVVGGMLTAFIFSKKHVYSGYNLSDYQLTFICATYIFFAGVCYSERWRILSILFIALAIAFNPLVVIYPRDEYPNIIYSLLAILMIPACIYIKPNFKEK